MAGTINTPGRAARWQICVCPLQCASRYRDGDTAWFDPASFAQPAGCPKTRSLPDSLRKRAWATWPETRYYGSGIHSGQRLGVQDFCPMGKRLAGNACGRIPVEQGCAFSFIPHKPFSFWRPFQSDRQHQPHLQVRPPGLPHTPLSPASIPPPALTKVRPSASFGAGGKLAYPLCPQVTTPCHCYILIARGRCTHSFPATQTGECSRHRF